MQKGNICITVIFNVAVNFCKLLTCKAALHKLGEGIKALRLVTADINRAPDRTDRIADMIQIYNCFQM